MSWQRPPFNPHRAQLWSGGFSRVFGVVSDGATRTYGLKEFAGAYLVLFDGVVVSPEQYSIDTVSATVAFQEVPPAGGWIEIIGFGAGGAAPVIPPARYLTADMDTVREKLAGLAPAVSPRFAVNQTQGTVHSTNGAAVGSDGDVYLIPQDEYDIIRVDTADKSLERIRVPGLDLYDYAKFAGGLTGPNGRIYGCPDKAAAVMEFDPVTRTGRMLSIEPTYGDHVWTNDMISTGAEVDGIVYGIPFDADYFMIVTGHGQSVRYDTLGLDLSPPGKWYGGVYYKGEFFAVPYNHTAILRIRSGGVVETIPLTTRHPEYACKYRGGCVVGNKAYFAPFEADHVLIVDLDTFQMTEETWGLDLTGRFKFWGCAEAEGTVVFVPFGSKLFMEVDLAANTAGLTDYGLPEDLFRFEHSYAGAYTDRNQRIHILAYQAGCGMLVDPRRKTGYARRTTDRHGLYLNSSSGVKFADGCRDEEGRVYVNPYNTGDVHWTIDTRQLSVDRVETGAPGRVVPEKDAVYQWHFDGVDVCGALDYGDHYWWLKEDGDCTQYRMSGYPAGHGSNYSPPAVYDPGHFPKFKWGRHKAFFNMERQRATERVIAFPSSQPYFVARDASPQMAPNPAPAVNRIGLSRDQFWNGAVLGADGLMYGIPYNGTHVMIFDPVPELARLQDFGLDLLGRRKWYGGVRAGNRIYGIPFDDTRGVLVIDTAAGTVEIQDFGLDWSGRRKFMCGARMGQYVIFVPCDHSRFFRLDLTTGLAEFVDYGIPGMNQTLKWGACAVDAQGALVLGPLGSIGTATADKRSPAWIRADGKAGWTSAKFNGCGAGTFIVNESGRVAFRIKNSFGNITQVPGYPAGAPMVAPLNLAAGATAVPVGGTVNSFLPFRNNAAHGWNTDCIFTRDQWVYCMPDERDLVFSVRPEDYSVYNERFDDVPGIRPWLGLAPAAWAQYDPDEESMYPVKELRAYRKEAGWNDPIFMVNNTAYGIPCSAGVVTRNTITQYNHFRSYLRHTNHFERCFWGAVEHGGKYYAAPHALPVLNILDIATETASLRRFDPPAGWDHTVLWKDGTSFGEYVVFYPYKQKWFAYYRPGDDTWAFPGLPDNLCGYETGYAATETVWIPPDPNNPKDEGHFESREVAETRHNATGCLTWVRRGDYVWGIPYNNEFFLKWDLATRTVERIDAPPESEDWKGRLWSDAVTFDKSESHPERDPVFLLPYNDDRLGLMYPWQRAAGPHLDLEHFHARFPGQRKWSCWAVPYAEIAPPVIYGVPCAAHGFLVCDVRGAEPYIDDFGLQLNWSETMKWMSAVDLLYKSPDLPDPRPISLTVPYNAECILAIDHWTGKIHEVEYAGPSLSGSRKWWGGCARMYGETGMVYFAPYDAQGVLALQLSVTVEENLLRVRATGHLMDFGLSMVGAGKWRGAIFLGPEALHKNSNERVVMIPCNSEQFLVLKPPRVTEGYAVDAKLDVTQTTAYFDRLGVPQECLVGAAKWADKCTTCSRDTDARTAPREHEFPAHNSPYTLRLIYDVEQGQALATVHEQQEGDRGWMPVRHRLPFAPKYQRSWAIPWDTDSFLALEGSKLDVFCAGWRMQRPAKFVAACIDRDNRIVCLPEGGYQALVYDPDANRAQWVNQSSALDGAPSQFSEFAYMAPGGRIFAAVRAACRNRFDNLDFEHMSFAQQRAADWRTLRPVHPFGDGFVFDYAVEYQDTLAFWPRWFSYAGFRTDHRWRDVCEEEHPGADCLPATPVYCATETRRHGCVFSGAHSFGLLPGNTGSMILYLKLDGRAPFWRIQAAFNTESDDTVDTQPQPDTSGAGVLVNTGDGAVEEKKVRTPPTFAVALGRPGYVWLIPTETYITPELRTGSSDPIYLHEIEMASGAVTHHRLECPWYAKLGIERIQLAVVPAGRYAWLLPKAAVTKPDGVHFEEGALRVDLWNFATQMMPCPGLDVEGGRWHPRVFATASGVWAVPNTATDPLLHFSTDGSACAVEPPTDSILAFTAVRYPLQSRYPPALAFDGSTVYSVQEKTTQRYVSGVHTPIHTRELSVYAYEFDTGRQDSFTLSDELSAEAPTGMVQAAVYLGGKIYCTLGRNTQSTDKKHQHSLWYAAIDLTAKTVERKLAPGAPTLPTTTGFVAADGKIWFEAQGNDRLIRYLRLDPETGQADEPVRHGRHVGTQMYEQFNSCQAVEGDRRFLAPAVIHSRSSVLYILDTAGLSLRSYGYVLACKDTHKWNGLVHDDGRYAYGMPFNNDTILRLDFADPDNVKADQKLVDDYAYVENYTHGGDMNFIFHKSGPGEGHARGGVVSKYGVVRSAAYAPRDGQTLEIQPNGRTVVRVPGPDYVSARKWADIVEGPGGKLYGAPFDAQEVFYIDPEAERAGSSYANMHEGLEGREKYSIAVAGPDLVYMIPYSAEDFLVVDPAAELLSKWLPPGLDLSGKRKWWGAARVGDEVFCVPFDAADVLKFNPVTRETALLPVPGDTGTAKWRGWVEAGDGVLYAPPFCAPDILSLNPATGEMERFTIDMDFTGAAKWSHAALSRDGKTIFAAGGSEYAFLRLTLNDDGTMSAALIEGARDASPNSSRFGGVCQLRKTMNGVVVDSWIAAPATTDRPAVVDGDTVKDGYAITGDTDGGISDRWMGGCPRRLYDETAKAYKECFVTAPYDHSMVGNIDAEGRTTLTAVSALIEGEAKWADVGVYLDKIYMIPWNHDKWLKLDVDYVIAEQTDFGKPVPEGTERWSALWRSGSYFYGVPYNARSIARLSIGTDTVTYSNCGLLDSQLVGDAKWLNCVEMSGNAFCPPYNATAMLILRANGAATTRTPRLLFPAKQDFCGGVPFAGGQLWANCKYDFPCLYAANGDVVKARPGYFGLTMADAEGAWRYGGAHGIDDEHALLLPGSNGSAAVFKRADGGVSAKTALCGFSVSGGSTAAQCVAATTRAGAVYLWPFDSQGVVKYDPETEVFANITTLTTEAGEGGKLFSGGYLHADGSLYGVPFNATKQFRIDPDDAVSAVTLPGVSLSGSEKWWGCCSAGGRHFFIPYSSDKVVVVAADGTASETDYGLDMTGTEKWRGGVVRGKYVIGIPYQSSDFLVIDTEQDTAFLYQDTSGLLGSGRYGGFVDTGDTVTMTPAAVETPADVAFRIEPTFGAGVTKRDPVIDWEGEEKFCGGFVDKDNKIVMVPARAPYFMKYDPVSAVVWTTRYGIDLSSPERKYSGVAVAGDFAYLAGGALNRVRISISADAATVFNAVDVQKNDVGVAAIGDVAYVLNQDGGRTAFRNGVKISGPAALAGPTGFTFTPTSFRGLRAHVGKLYSATYDSNFIFRNAPASTTAAWLPAVPVEGRAKWYGFVPAPDESAAYALPFNDPRVLYHDGVRAWVIDYDDVPEGQRRWMGGCWHKGRLYGCPYDAESIAVFDPETRELTFETYGADLAGRAKWSFCFSRGDEIFFMPATAKYALVVDPEQRTVRTVECPHATGEELWRAWVLRGDAVYGIPYHAADPAVFDAVEETFTTRRAQPDIAVAEGWGCGCATEDGHKIVFLPHGAEKALTFTPSTRRGRLSFLGARAVVERMRPFAGVVRWHDPYELTAAAYAAAGAAEDDAEDDAEDAPTEAAEAPTGFTYAWYALSADSGVAQFHRDTGLLSEIRGSWNVNPLLPEEQVYGFAFSGVSGKIYGAPYNGNGTVAVDKGGTATCGRLCEDMKVTSEKFLVIRKVGDETFHEAWRVYADNYICGVRNTRLEPISVGGSARKNLRLDSFTGILYATELNAMLEWDRPKEVIPVPFGEPIVIVHTLWENKYGVVGGAALGPDGLVYHAPNGAYWGFTQGNSDILDRIYTPIEIAFHLGENGDVQERRRLYSYSSACLDSRGNIVWGPGLDVTAGKIGKSGAGFISQTWFALADEATADSLGHTSFRAKHRVPFIETGVKGDCAAMYALSRFLSGG